MKSRRREEINLLEQGGASEDDVLAAKAKYHALSNEYAAFSKAMNLPQQRERISIDGFKGVDVSFGKPAAKAENPVAKSTESGIIKADRSISSRNLPSGLRTPTTHILTDEEIQMLKVDISTIGADPSVFKFNEGSRTGYDDILDEIRVKGDILPDLASDHPRDRMSSRAALAHEYYGHRAYRGTKLQKGSWNDEFRASYMAAKNCPNLTLSDRRYLILDALERAKKKGITITHNSFIRRMLYGY